MKKSLKIMSALMLFSSIAFSAPTVNSIVHAEETSAPENEEASALRATLQDLVNQANAMLATPDLYTEDSLSRVATSMANGQNALNHNMEESYNLYITSLKNALSQVVVATPPSSTESSSTESSSTESSSTESSSTESSSTESSSTESSSTGSSSTESSSTESSSTESSSTESSSTESSSTESSSTESSSTESSSTDEAKPSIELATQAHTMYVGQVLNEDIILSWATFNNAEGYMVGFEILGNPIQVTAAGNVLVEPGTHTIKYYVSKPTRSVDNVVAEKELTLTVLPESENPLNITQPEQKPGKPADNLITQSVTPVANDAKKSIASAKTKGAQLPATGETNNNMMLASAGILLIAGAYIFRKKQVEK